MASPDLLPEPPGSSHWSSATANAEGKGPASTLPRAASRQSSLLRRRFADLASQLSSNSTLVPPPGPRRPISILPAAGALFAGSTRMSMPADMDDYLDLSDIVGAAEASAAAASASAHVQAADVSDAGIHAGLGGTEDSMLQALLSSLPEPPLTRPDTLQSSAARSPASSQQPSPPTSPALLAANSALLMPPANKFNLPMSPFTSVGFPAAITTALPRQVPATDDSDDSAALTPLTAPEPSIVVGLPQQHTTGSSHSLSPSISRELLAREAAAEASAVDRPVAVARSITVTGSPLKDVDDDEDEDDDCGLPLDEQMSQLSTALETPASSRRNTDEVPLTPQHRECLQRLSLSASSDGGETDTEATTCPLTLLDAELPPTSPFFSCVSEADITDAREAVRRASLSRRSRHASTASRSGSVDKMDKANVRQNGTHAERGTWCAATTDKLMDSLQLPAIGKRARTSVASVAWPLDRWSSPSPTASPWHMPKDSENTADPASLSSSLASADQWVENQEPVISPLFDSDTEPSHTATPGHEVCSDPSVATEECLSVADSAIVVGSDEPAVKDDRASTCLRTFKIDVYSLFTSPLGSRAAPRVVIRECAESGELLAPIDMPIDDADVRSALRRYPWLLALLRRQKEEQTRRGDRVSVGGVGGGSARQPTGLRLPSRRPLNRLCSPASATDCGRERPTLSFSVANARTLGSLSDRHVRAVDVDAMVEAYLPRVHALLHADGSQDTPSESGRTLSESSSATLVAKAPSSEQPGSQLSASQSEDLLSIKQKQYAASPSSIPTLSASTSASGIRLPISGIRKPSRRSDVGLAGSRPEAPKNTASRQLRASTTMLNLRSAYTEKRISGNSGTLAQGTLTKSMLPTPVSRRRSEIEALLTQANAVLGSGLRRSSTFEQSHSSPAATLSDTRIRPPRASFPLSFSSSSSSARMADSHILHYGTMSPRSFVTGSVGSRASVMSDPMGYESSLPSRIPSPISGIRTPTTSLTAALSRQQHRLESARNGGDGGASGLNNEISPLTLTPVRSLNAEMLASNKNSANHLRMTSSLSGIRPPSISIGSMPPPGSVGAGASATTQSQTQTPTQGRRQAQQSYLGANTPAARPAYASNTKTPSGIRRPPSTTRLRPVGVTTGTRGAHSTGSGARAGLGDANYGESDSDEQFMYEQSSITRRPGGPQYSGSASSMASASSGHNRQGGRRQVIPGFFKQDDEFLTLRPVHTPDIVPRTIDPRLVERAMTPMLKTNAGILHSSIADILRSNASIRSHAAAVAATGGLAAMCAEGLVDCSRPSEDDFSDFGLGSAPQSPVAAASMLSVVHETPSPVAEQQTHQSRMSPLNSPIGSPVLEKPDEAPKGDGRRASTSSGRSSFSGRFGRPSFLSRNKKQTSPAAPSMVSAIPLPSFSSLLSSGPKSAFSAKKPAAAAAPTDAPLSKIPNVRKARSLWTLRSSIAK
ncbi:hypothetical protein GGI07_001738 [Coemansia sp. Benny D115]|nr:hypothetical protein GGI07_001738 [Coemansia sp. Benny D115]